MRYCSRCGAQNKDHAAICHCCGSKLPPPGAGAYYPHGYQPPRDPRPTPKPHYYQNDSYNYYQVPQRQPSSSLSLSAARGFAIASMSCGILSLFTIGVFAIVLGICGLVFGALVKNAGYSRGYISGMSVAGLVCGIVGVAFSLIWIFAVGSLWLWF